MLGTPGLSVAQEAADLAQDLPTVRNASDEGEQEIIVYGRALDQIGIAQTGSQGTVGYADFDNLPISRTGELVENVPGVIATQHSGSGKANQYFLRGFNLDHGTDFAGFVDGVPINMPTHGQGQGYLDFNFLIPETIERIDFRKGPYFADVGDFSSAGTIAFTTVDVLAPFAEVEIGEFGFLRGVAGGSAKAGSGDILIAAEAQSYDGPWVLEEDLERFVGLVKYSGESGAARYSVQFNAYDARWTSTDQVPERAVASGLIDRFGFIDDDLGGRMTRFGAVANATIGDTAVDLYLTHHDFRLVSNFTYFLEDPVEGDEFVQVDERTTMGGSVSHTFDLDRVDLTIGGDLRHDDISRTGLFRSVDAVATDAVRLDAVDETLVAGYVSAQAALLPGLRAFAGLRYDHIFYDVSSDLAANSGDGDDGLLAPNGGLAWAVLDSLELYASYGQSFHSNDVRGATITLDPVSLAPADRVPVFARSDGAELGARIERGRFNASLVGFWLELDSELVFVGDGGATEPNDGSQRYGVEATLFWQPTPWLVIDAVYARTDARFIGPPRGQREIPGAVPEVVSGGMTVNASDALTFTAQLRHFGSAPLIEDGSVTSDPTTLVNLGGYWKTGPLVLGAEIFNLFDARDADITYFYESRLASETAGVEDRHFHPVEPLQVRASVRYRF
ncbi:TonB-dependent receptor [Qipengyuania sp. MTN3-11]|uniref:TonB-dependent receptor n=1 Tax=Qipengyuania sp. MTN3-11 TaxID=3056557 RepID=UPI0036F3612C